MRLRQLIKTILPRAARELVVRILTIADRRAARKRAAQDAEFEAVQRAGVIGYHLRELLDANPEHRRAILETLSR